MGFIFACQLFRKPYKHHYIGELCENRQPYSHPTLKGRSAADIFFVRATPTSSQVTLQLATQLERGCKHYLPNKQPAESALASLPPFSSLRWNRPQQQTLWSSAPATRLRYLRPTLPAIQLPQQQRTQKHNRLG